MAWGAVTNYWKKKMIDIVLSPTRFGKKLSTVTNSNDQINYKKETYFCLRPNFSSFFIWSSTAIDIISYVHSEPHIKICTQSIIWYYRDAFTYSIWLTQKSMFIQLLFLFYINYWVFISKLVWSRYEVCKQKRFIVIRTWINTVVALKR